jgi:hypothetical protein
MTQKQRLYEMYLPVHEQIEDMLQTHSPDHVFAELCKQYGAKHARFLLAFYSDLQSNLA